MRSLSDILGIRRAEFQYPLPHGTEGHAKSFACFLRGMPGIEYAMRRRAIVSNPDSPTGNEMSGWLVVGYANEGVSPEKLKDLLQTYAVLWWNLEQAKSNPDPQAEAGDA